MTDPNEDVLNMLEYSLELDEQSDEELCRRLLRSAPLFGKLGMLIEVVCERLSPGIIDKMDPERKP